MLPVNLVNSAYYLIQFAGIVGYYSNQFDLSQRLQLHLRPVELTRVARLIDRVILTVILMYIDSLVQLS